MNIHTCFCVNLSFHVSGINAPKQLLVSIVSTCLKSAYLFPSGSTIYISTRNLWMISGFSASSPAFGVINILYFRYTKIHVQWCHTVALICISLMAGDIEHIFTCLFAIHLSFPVKFLFKSFAHFLLRLFLRIQRSLCSLDISPLWTIFISRLYLSLGSS